MSIAETLLLAYQKYLIQEVCRAFVLPAHLLEGKNMTTPAGMWRALKDINNEAQKLVDEVTGGKARERALEQELIEERTKLVELRAMHSQLSAVAVVHQQEAEAARAVLLDVRRAAKLEGEDGVCLSKHVKYLAGVEERVYSLVVENDRLHGEVLALGQDMLPGQERVRELETTIANDLHKQTNAVMMERNALIEENAALREKLKKRAPIRIYVDSLDIDWREHTMTVTGRRADELTFKNGAILYPWAGVWRTKMKYDRELAAGFVSAMEKHQVVEVVEEE